MSCDGFQRAASARVDRALDAMGAAWDPAERAKLSRELVASLNEAWPIAGIKVNDGWIDLGALSFDETK